MEALGTLASGIAHEFNNVLTGILNHAVLIQYHNASGDEILSDVEEILAAGHRAQNLVQQIMTFSHQHDVDLQPLRLEAVIQDALRFLRALLPATIEMRQHIAQDTGTVLADPTQIHQVLINLCTNAEHAMRETGGVLEVRLESVEPDEVDAESLSNVQSNAYVRLSVRDMGGGIPLDVQQRMFDPFFTTKKIGEGTGMGLAVVSGIVTSYKGIITVDSTMGKGTTFAIYLPCVNEPVPTISHPKAPLQRSLGRLLLVDDDVLITYSTQRFLTMMGYEVSAYTSSQAALTAFAAAPSHFDLVVTDQAMFEMTGEQLAQALRRIRPDIPIIICTGYSQTVNANRTQATEIDAFCMKPLSERELAATIQQILAQRDMPKSATDTSAG